LYRLITGGVEKHFVKLLVDVILSVEYIKLSMGMAQEVWFGRFCNLSEVDRSLFNNACQKMLSYLYTHFEETLGKANNMLSPPVSFRCSDSKQVTFSQKSSMACHRVCRTESQIACFLDF
jgi:hypothetical protein